VNKAIRIGIGSLIALIAVALLFGAAYQYVANRRDLSEHPAPGQLVDVGGHRLHLWCIGRGSPVVVLEAGGAGTVLDWSRVQPEVANTTRVCSYDRAGLGWSELGPAPRSGQQIVRELHRLLHAAHVSGPYVFTGHSIGGLYVRLYASAYPQDVTGMVLVDATHEDVQTRIPGSTINPLLLHLVVGMHSMMGVVGWPRFMDTRFTGGPGLSAEARVLAEGIKFRTTMPYADGEESLAWAQSATEVRQTRRRREMPIVVITRGRWDGLRGLSEDQRRPIKRAWEDMQRDLVTLSSQGTYVVASHSEHYVQLEQPHLVIDAIRGTVAAARGHVTDTRR
jgi:pimeloyl-ACP methyl ester carboxylesterase